MVTHHVFGTHLESVQDLELPTDIFMAVDQDDLEALEESLNEKAALTQLIVLNHQGNNALHYSIVNQRLDTLEFLINFLLEEPMGKRILEEPNDKGVLPLHLACMYGDGQAAMVLLSYEACYANVLDVRTPGAGMTALMWAVQRGQAQVALELMRRGARLSGRGMNDERGRTIATMAMQRGHLDLLKMLLEESSEQAFNLMLQEDGAKLTAVDWAVENGENEALEMLLEVHIENDPIKLEKKFEAYNDDPHDETNLLNRAAYHSPECLRVLLDRKEGRLEGPLREKAQALLGKMYLAGHDMARSPMGIAVREKVAFLQQAVEGIGQLAVCQLPVDGLDICSPPRRKELGVGVGGEEETKQSPDLEGGALLAPAK